MAVVCLAEVNLSCFHLCAFIKCCYPSQKSIGYTTLPSLRFLPSRSVFFASFCEYRIYSNSPNVNTASCTPCRPKLCQRRIFTKTWKSGMDKTPGLMTQMKVLFVYTHWRYFLFLHFSNFIWKKKSASLKKVRTTYCLSDTICINVYNNVTSQAKKAESPYVCTTALASFSHHVCLVRKPWEWRTLARGGAETTRTTR